MINKSNYEYWQNVANALQTEIAQFKNQQAAPADEWPMSVEDLPENKGECWYNRNNSINHGCYMTPEKSEFSTEKDAKSAFAFAQLSRLIRHVNKGVEYRWDENRDFGCIVIFDHEVNHLKSSHLISNVFAPNVLIFQNREDAQRSIETWRQLWLDYFQVDEQ